LPEVKSVISVGLNYAYQELPSGGTSHQAWVDERPTRGVVAKYAQGRDYHKVFAGKFRRLSRAIAETFPEALIKTYTDTGPVLEKLWAERAGIGWRGKHTNLVSPEFGSWLLLGELLTNLDLPADEPHVDRCGTCTNCLEICPTKAFPAPYELDARRCISYLTIEHRGFIDPELRPLMGQHVFGCDDCIDVCPWNRFAQVSREADFKPRPELVAPLLQELVSMDEETFYARFSGTPVTRAKREGLARNACIALGNARPVTEPALEALKLALRDNSAIVRGHAVWALGELGESRAVLLAHRDVESDAAVLKELDAVIEG
ncbi:MAG: tRNA epoxyqueuosine(34) reductase QueG, partial [Candidatus Eisenbacteria bacterium]|nr:tRNA epoxyqueuosine(34) reductase QueG [Candidatus Eisenbacteria bacterium]